MRVEVHLLHQSQPVVIEDVRNAYSKDSFYCVMVHDGPVSKFPVEHIFRVQEFS